MPAWAADCTALSIEHGANVEDFISDRYAWSDEECKPRSAAMVRNTRQDPVGLWGGYMREYRYQFNGTTRVAKGSLSDHPGFGYLVNHHANGSDTSRRNRGLSYATVLAGRHHAIHEYRWTYPINGKNVTATVQWLFATGRSYPLWAVTFDASGLAADALSADTRAPYGDITWDGGANADVDGVGWGDRYKFKSLNQPITMQSGWDYTEPNTIPYVVEWSARADAEMGLVQTQTFHQHDAGGYWFYSSWGKRNTGGPMPQDYNWTYQLDQYELPWGSKSKRMAWGANLGAVGSPGYNVYGDDAKASGYPYQSYSVYIVLDPHSSNPVFAQVADVETVQKTKLSATVGAAVTSGPRGVARPDSGTYELPGYNPVYGTWEVLADSNNARFEVAVSQGGLVNPVFVVRDWTSAGGPRVKVAGTALEADKGYYASVDTTGSAAWITIPGRFTGTTEIDIAP